jgi:hypothetical protein
MQNRPPRGPTHTLPEPHGATVRCLPDGRWYDPARQTWRGRRGRTTRWPDLEQLVRLRTTRSRRIGMSASIVNTAGHDAKVAR